MSLWRKTYSAGGSFTSDANTTLYAVWSTNKYTITYDGNGSGVTGVPASVQKTYGVALTLSSTKPSRIGYTFLGWSTSSSATTATYSAGSSFTADANTTLYAVWSAATAMSLNTAYRADINVAGKTIFYKFIPSQSGKYTFFSNNDAGDPYGYLYNANGQELSYDDDSRGDRNFSITYSLSAGQTYYLKVKLYNSSETGTFTVTVVNAEYTITYNGNGSGVSEVPESVQKTHGETLTLSSTAPTRIGYTFLGWSTSSSATTATYSAGGSFTTDANTMLYAVWSAATAMSLNTAYRADINVAGETVFYKFTPSQSGKYIFFSNNDAGDPYGYLYDANGQELACDDDSRGNRNFSITHSLSAGQTYYLKVKLYSSSETGTFIVTVVSEEYTITYNGNGSGVTGVPESVQKTHGVALTLSSKKPTRTDYTFLGWSTSSSATTATYSAGGSFTSDANTTLYAVWSKNIGERVVVTSVSLNKSTLSLNPGATVSLTATINPANAINKTVTWSSDKTSVATVNQNGVIKAVDAGIATITVKTVDGGKTAKCTVTVTSSTVAVTSVSVTGVVSNMIIGNTRTLTAKIMPSNASDKTVTWKSSDTKVATVGKSTGKVTAKGAGTAQITATAGGKSKTVTITVHSYVTLRLNKTTAIQNGTKTTIDSQGTKPFIISGKTMVPMRFVAEKMGGKVSYKSDAQPIVMTYGDRKVEIRLNSKEMKVTVDGKAAKVTLEVAAQTKNGRTYIPLRAISQALGFTVYYDAGTEIIVVNNPSMSTAIRNERIAEGKKTIK